jgi:uncharacterized protein YlaI
MAKLDSKFIIINIPSMCCHCTSKNSLLELQVPIRYLKYHFFFVKVYRDILIKTFICKPCSDRLDKNNEKLHQNIAFAIFINIVCIFLQYLSISSIWILFISLPVTILILFVTNRPAFFPYPKISFFPPLRIIFPSKEYTSLFKALNPDLKL